MKILVYGAGVLGCNLARNLFRAGKDAALLARGSWAEELQTNGLRIKDTFSPRMSVSRIPVVTALKPEDPYDVIFAAVSFTRTPYSQSVFSSRRDSGPPIQTAAAG